MKRITTALLLFSTAYAQDLAVDRSAILDRAQFTAIHQAMDTPVESCICSSTAGNVNMGPGDDYQACVQLEEKQVPLKSRRRGQVDRVATLLACGLDLSSKAMKTPQRFDPTDISDPIRQNVHERLTPDLTPQLREIQKALEETQRQNRELQRKVEEAANKPPQVIKEIVRVETPPAAPSMIDVVNQPPSGINKLIDVNSPGYQANVERSRSLPQNQSRSGGETLQPGNVWVTDRNGNVKQVQDNTRSR